MNRDALGPALVAALAVLALGVGAAALDTPTDASGDASRGGGDVGVFDGSRFDLGQPPSAEATVTPSIPQVVFQALGVVLVLAFLVGLYHLRDELGYGDLGIVIVGSLVLVGVMGVLLAGARLFGGGRNATNGSAGFLGSSRPALGGGSSAEGAARTVAIDPPMIAVVVGLVVLAGGLTVVWRGRDERTEPKTEAEPGSTGGSGTVAELGHAAGRAADRIADEGEPTNEVYRAWEEMTDYLDVNNPGASTPSEFARAATDAGMARNDVDELTDLFRTVRYGGRRVTDDRENRAVDALRNIEREYAEES